MARWTRHGKTPLVPRDGGSVDGDRTGAGQLPGGFTAQLPDEIVSTHVFGQVLCLNPTSKFRLKAKGDTCEVEVTFSPKCRIEPFAEEVVLECSGLVRSLFMVRGSCQGIRVSLDRDHLSFGAVVQQSYTSQQIVMQNTGDMGVK